MQIVRDLIRAKCSVIFIFVDSDRFDRIEGSRLRLPPLRLWRVALRSV